MHKTKCSCHQKIEDGAAVIIVHLLTEIVRVSVVRLKIVLAASCGYTLPWCLCVCFCFVFVPMSNFVMLDPVPSLPENQVHLLGCVTIKRNRKMEGQ